MFYGNSIRASVLCLLFLAAAISVSAAPGDLDPSFGNGGIVLSPNPSGYRSANAVAIQADGKIVTAGADGGYAGFDFILARYNTDGSPDSTFGSGGKVITTFGSLGSYANAIAIQSDGKIVAVGYNFTLVRYNTNGSLDTSFGSGGIASTTSSIGGSYSYAMAIQPDGKIVVGGSGNASAFALVRYNTDGSLDSTFGTSGKVLTNFNGYSAASAVAIQSDGKIVAVGISGGSTFSSFTLVRYNADGSLDSTFGIGGKVVTRIGDKFDSANAAAIQSDGKIVVAGNIWESSGGTRFALARYLNNSVTPPAVPSRTRFDFDGDGRADVSVFRPDNGTWYIQPGNSGNFYGVQFGISTDKIVPADYDGDGKTDIAVYRDGVWYWLNSSDGTFSAYQFGLANDIPQPADYTGDRRAELAVYRGGGWFTLDLTNNQFRAAQFGIASDKPVAADYDGDGKTDMAVVRQGGGLSFWYISGSTRGFYGFQFGFDTDKLVPADYDNDGKTDVAVYRNGTWYISVSTQFFPITAQLGTAGDIPVPADYDGDGKADIAIYRNGIWHLQRSTSGFTGVPFGANTDKPVPNAFVP